MPFGNKSDTKKAGVFLIFIKDAASRQFNVPRNDKPTPASAKKQHRSWIGKFPLTILVAHSPQPTGDYVRIPGDLSMPILRFNSASNSPPPPRQLPAMAATGLIDPTRPGRYPVILSDALLGKPSKEAYTGIRCRLPPLPRPLPRPLHPRSRNR